MAYTVIAPAFKSCLDTAFKVAPDVYTSSTNKTVLPFICLGVYHLKRRLYIAIAGGYGLSPLWGFKVYPLYGGGY